MNCLIGTLSFSLSIPMMLSKSRTTSEFVGHNKILIAVDKPFELPRNTPVTLTVASNASNVIIGGYVEGTWLTTGGLKPPCPECRNLPNFSRV